MKQILVVLSLLLASHTIFGQDNKSKTYGGSPVVDFVIVEMKLGAVLGGISNGEFVDVKTTMSRQWKSESLALYGLYAGLNEGEMSVTKIEEPDDHCPEYYSVKTENKAVLGVALSSGARWNAMPRLPKKIGVKSRVYKKIVKKFLIGKGIRKPKVKIQEIYRVDLEGDGQSEVIIRATNNKRFGASESVGDYSFVIVRKIVGKTVKNILLTGDFSKKRVEFSAPNRHEVSGILDLDGDGKMEIVVFGEYYEGSWVEAYQIKGAKAHKILQTGCGS